VSKYHARKVTAGGLTFDSQAEHRRWRELVLLEQAGEISHLAVHPAYPLIVNGVKVGVYQADFVYTDANGRRVTEDVKGVKTPVYRLKRKLMWACHQIAIVEVAA